MELFLVCAAFFPRLSLLVAFLLNALPANTTPFVLEIVLFFLAPRGMIAWWLYEGDYHPLWAVLFAALQLGEWFGGGTLTQRRVRG